MWDLLSLLPAPSPPLTLRPVRNGVAGGVKSSTRHWDGTGSSLTWEQRIIMWLRVLSTLTPMSNLSWITDPCASYSSYCSKANPRSGKAVWKKDTRLQDTHSLSARHSVHKGKRNQRLFHCSINRPSTWWSMALWLYYGLEWDIHSDYMLGLTEVIASAVADVFIYIYLGEKGGPCYPSWGGKYFLLECCVLSWL